jgi:hypothetical protein
MPKTKWQIHEETVATAHTDTKEQSIGTRLTNFRAPGQARTADDGIPRNAFGDKITKAADIEERRFSNATVVQPLAAKPHRVGKTVLDPATEEARLAYENSKAGLANQRTREARLQSMLYRRA